MPKTATLNDVGLAAMNRRDRRWETEKAERRQTEAHRVLVDTIAEWKKVPRDKIKMSNFACWKAPADLSCVFVASFNKFTNPCVFCGNPEDDIL